MHLTIMWWFPVLKSDIFSHLFFISCSEGRFPNILSLNHSSGRLTVSHKRLMTTGGGDQEPQRHGSWFNNLLTTVAHLFPHVMGRPHTSNQTFNSKGRSVPYALWFPLLYPVQY